MMKQDRERLLESARLRGVRLVQAVEAAESAERFGLVVNNVGRQIIDQAEALVLIGRSLQL